MPNTTQDAKSPFIEVGYEDKVVFIPKHNGQERSDLRAVWQESQGLWATHPVFHDMPIHDVIVWFRGEDNDV